MTSLHRPEPKQSSPVAKYGPLAAILVVIAVIAGVSISKRGPSGEQATTQGTGGGTGRNTDIPVVFADAKKTGANLADYGEDCDQTTGRIKMPSLFAPPCVPAHKAGADNGGATSKGVTKDKITIVQYKASANGDLSALLQGLTDSAEASEATWKAYVSMFNDMYETYGRKVEIIDFQSQAVMDDEVAAKADAIKIAEELNAFAVIGGPALAQSYAVELKERGVLCIGCGQGVPDATYQKLAPFVWGAQATPEQFLLNLGDLIAGRLNGKNAEFAGDPEMHNRQRVFGVVHFEQKVPVYKELEEQVAQAGKDLGYATAATETYVLEIAKLGERATTIVAKMKAANVTSVIFLGDPIMPIYLTKAATEQNYFPEWIVTGTVLTDTNVFGRRYDQKQWKNAFGISSLPAKMPREKGDAWRLHKWYFGDKEPAAKTTGPLIYAGIQLAFLGVHMAGPKLSPDTFRDGLFNFPPTGGGVTSPQVSFGNHGFFANPITKKSSPDYLGIDDVALIWWDTEAEGPDESGTVGKGLWRYIDNGARYLPGEMPKTDLPVGQVDNTVTILDDVPADERPPTYPAPNRPLP